MFLRPRGFAVEMISAPVAKFNCAVAARQRKARYFGSGRDSNLSELRSQAVSLGLRDATIEDVRTALENVHGVGTRQQYILRAKSLLGYAHKVGYTPFNVGAVIKIKPDSAHRGATLAKRIISPAEVANQAAPSKRNRVLLEVTYAGAFASSSSSALWPHQAPNVAALTQPSRKVRVTRCVP